MNEQEMAAAIIVSFAAIIGAYLSLFTDYSKKDIPAKSFDMKGKAVKVQHWDETKGRVLYEGESWKAKSEETLELKKNDTAYVKEHSSTVLTITL